ncbi:response regulator [candidate division FCPU426 bacterium]|nr:response regulator [candidate division FCPU426 bacterium]
MPESDFHLLVVEDEVSIREPIVLFLKSQGFQVDAAENGIEALHCIRLRAYDLIILDLKMPYIDGQQLTQALQDENIRVPILVTTAAKSKEKLYQEVGRLHKIFTLKTLGQEVRGILQKEYPNR